MSKRRPRTEVERYDRPWSATKIRLLLDGECLVNDGEDLISAQSAFEQRQRAYDGYGDVDSILDAIQLDMAIDSIRDNEVRIAMKLRSLAAWDEYAIEEALGSKRAGHHLLNRGCDLVRRNEKGNAGKVRRRKEARMADELAGLEDPPPVKRKRGRQHGGVPIDTRSLEWLIKTQDSADKHMPGQEAWLDNTRLMGDLDSAGLEPGWSGLDSGRKRSNHKGCE